jgi:hypothetical protein
MLVVCDPSLPASSVTQTRIVFAPSASRSALTVVVLGAGVFAYVSLSLSSPVVQLSPPTRTV